MSFPSSHIMYYYSEINDDIIELKKGGIEVYNGVPNKEEILLRPRGLLLILDDLLSEISPEFLDQIFTRGSHHWGVSVILVTQNLFDKKIKVARTNSHYIILMKNPQGMLQIKTLASQLFTGQVPYFMEAYNDAVQQKNFGYILISMSPRTKDEYRLSTNVFPGEKTIIYLPII
jgi:hypothetical protein